MQNNQIIAKLYDQDIVELPKDLFISPEALKIFLEMFEGPLDLLLYLIRKQNIDILKIPIIQITEQYIQYINAMSTLNLNLAADYLVMAATLLTIKSKFMLPDNPVINDNEEEIDPIKLQKDLIEKLLEYEKIKILANNLNEMPRLERDFLWVNVNKGFDDNIKPTVTINQLRDIWYKIINTKISNTTHLIRKEEFSINSIMDNIISKLKLNQEQNILQLFDFDNSIQHNIVTFIAILELIKQSLIKLKFENSDIIIALVK
jgi:segregation and condensation protein A